MTSPVRTISVLLAILLFASTAAAQTNTVDDFREIGQKIVTASKIFPLMRTAAEGPGSPEPTVLLLSTSDGTVAKARIGYLLKEYVSFDVSFSAPVSGGTGRFLTEKGLGGGVSGEGSLRLVLYRKQRAVPVSSGFLSGSQSTMGMSSLASTVTGQGLTSSFSFDQLIGAALETAQSIQAVGGPAAARATISSVPSGAIASSIMTPAQVTSAANQLPGERGREAFASAFRLLANDFEGWQVDRSVVLSMGTKIGRPEFTIADSASFRNITRRARIGELSLGLIQSASRDTLTRGFYAGVTVTAGNTFSATQRQTCLPAGENGGSQCRNALLAEPGEANIELYQGDFRYFFSGLKFAVGFRPGYNREAAENEKWSIEFPLMFLQNSKDLQSALSDDKAGLTGGVTVGVKDSPDGKSFYALFSVGSVFKLPGLPR